MLDGCFTICVSEQHVMSGFVNRVAIAHAYGDRDAMEKDLRAAFTGYFLQVCPRLSPLPWPASTSEIAAKLQCSESQVRQMRSGDRNVGIKQLTAIAHALGESPFAVLANVIAVGLGARVIGADLVAPGSRGTSRVEDEVAKEMAPVIRLSEASRPKDDE